MCVITYTILIYKVTGNCLQVIAYQKAIYSAQEQETTGPYALYSETTDKSEDQEVNNMYIYI